VSSEQEKPRKILGNPDSPYVDRLKNLISTQSRHTVLQWAIDYVSKTMLPIFEASFPDDSRPRVALEAAAGFISDDRPAEEIKADLQARVLDCHASARAAESVPAAQAAARACAQASSSPYELGHTLAIAFYGAAAQAYNSVGTGADAATYEKLAEAEITRQCDFFDSMAVANEPNPTGIEWIKA